MGFSFPVLLLLLSLLSLQAFSRTIDPTRRRMVAETNSTAEEHSKPAPPIYEYIDDSGATLTISNFSEEYYFNRLHTARLGGSTGETVYWVNIYVGTPPQKQSAIIDTGSSLLAFPCSDCGSNCGHHLSRPFNISASMTSWKMSCHAEFEKFRCS